MSVATHERQSSAPTAVSGGRQRRAEPVTDRVRRDGKFFRVGGEKFYVKGVTYGPFAPNREGLALPERAQVRRDFEQIRDLGANCVRIYHIPPRWFLDLAQETGLKIFLDVAWPKNLTFVGDEEIAAQAHAAVREAALKCGNHPATFAISVVNEIPPDIVRYVGAEKIEEFVDELVMTAKAEAPDCLITFANFPTTEYLQPKNIDFICFNVYLHDETVFRNYLARLHSIAGDKPLMLGEYGIDTMREHNEDKQAEILANHVRAVFDEGCVGTFIFSYTDDWFTHGYQIEDWAFGLTRRDRSPKPAFAAVKALFARVPQVAEVKLPKVSVVICSYNGASTIETCLRSMEKLKYPHFEVVFIDDGSTDGTQEILKKFPWVRNIRQKNMGLSHARNVGMNAAEGEIVVYTDSDCEADEDWLYYLALALVRSGNVGMGGPNLIPDEGSWVADCVGLSPGGPTHVMVDDRTAEHVPGCNMGYYTWALKQVNGFDPQFRKAGDDVDFIWRLQHLGYSIGFSPAAQVWHYRRNTVGAYLKQQRGYGEAEALLKYKHPDHFNTLGASHWRGKIYGGEQIGVRVGRDVIYHGLFGTGLFQTIYRKHASVTAMMMMSIEWHLLGMFVTVLGLAFPPLLWVALLMFFTPILLSGVAAVQAPMPRHPHPLSRFLIAYLHWRQPIARGWARYSVRLKAKVMKSEAKGYHRPHELPYDPDDRQVLRYWHHEFDRLLMLRRIREEVAANGWRMRLDSGWAGWDMEIYGSRYVKVRLTTATERHHGSGLLTRMRVQLMMSKFCIVLLIGSFVLAGLLLLHMWPFSRPAVLIPLAWWTMFLVNRWRVSGPVLGLIAETAERAGFYPIATKKSAETKPAIAEQTGSGQAQGLIPGRSTGRAGSDDGALDIDEDSTPSIIEAKSMRKILRSIAYFRDDAGKVIANLIMVALGTILGVLWPIPLAILIDSVLLHKNQTHWLYRIFLRVLPAETGAKQIIALALLMFGLRMASEILQFARTLVNIRIGYNGLMRVRCDLFKKLQELSLAYHRSQPQGDAIYRLSYDSLGFQSLLNTIVGAIVNVITLFAMAWVMFTMNWRLSLVSLAVIPPLLFTIHWYGGIFKKRYAQSFEVDSQVTTAIQRSVSSIGLVQAFGREADEYQKFFQTIGHNIAVKLKLHWDEVTYWLVLGTLFAISAAAITGYGGWLAYRGSLDVGMLTVFLLYLEKLYEPLKALSTSGSSYQGAMTQVERVFEVLDRDPVIQDAPDAVHMLRKPRALSLENVSFAYRQGAPVLQEISVTIAAGQMVAFVGSSGVGKTTLLNLLPRFYDPTTGAMKLDGIDVRKIKIADLRKHVALVLQDSVILPTSVSENIAYGRPEATDSQIHRAAELAGASTFIEKLPQKYETEITESGSNLSGGQKQRISIARALVTESPIIVMDEPTSALDPQHEQMITETLKSLKGLRTIILVSHRLSTVADCDRIFVMDEGRIAEEGTHDELVAKRGLYFKMAKHQMKIEDGPQISPITQMNSGASI